MCRSAAGECFFAFFAILSVLTGCCGMRGSHTGAEITEKQHILCGIAKNMEENMQKFSVISENNACKSNGFLI